MRGSILGGTRVLVRVLMVLNIIVGIAFFGIFLATLQVDGALLMRLSAKYGVSANAITTFLRFMLVTGVLAAGVAHVFLRALRQILASVAMGDPFIAENGRRLRRMGFAMLAFQIGDLILGYIDVSLDGLGADTVNWLPSIGGWLAVLLLFVLARVFAVGAAMRDELEGTV